MSSNPLANVVTSTVPAGGSESPSDVGPSGAANDFFRRMQAATTEKAPAADAAKPEEEKPETKDIVAQTPEASTAQALADAGKAPEGKAEPKKAESIRALVKGSNIPAEHKEEVTALAYQGKAAQEAGLTTDVIKAFKDLGISIPSIVERIRLHPAIEDGRRDALLAGEYRTFINDFIHNPQEVVRKLRLTSQGAGRPEIWSEFVAAVSQNIEQEARPLWLSKLNREVRHILNKLAQEAVDQKDETKQVSVENVQTMLGLTPGASGGQTQPVIDPKVQSLQNENDELKRRQAQQEAAQRDSFIAAASNDAKTAILRDIVDRFTAAKPTGMDDDESRRCVEEAFTKVGNELLANQNFVRDFESFRNGEISQRSHDLAVKFALERARSFIPIHLNASLAFYGKRALATAGAQDAKTAKAAAQTDAAKVTGVTPGPTKQPDVMDRLKAARGKGQRFSEAIFSALN